MQNIVTWHNITIYHTCVLHGMIHVLCAFVQIRSHIIDAKDSETQYFKVHITNSLQLSAYFSRFLVLNSTRLKTAAKILLFSELCKSGGAFGQKNLFISSFAGR